MDVVGNGSASLTFVGSCAGLVVREVEDIGCSTVIGLVGKNIGLSDRLPLPLPWEGVCMRLLPLAVPGGSGLPLLLLSSPRDCGFSKAIGLFDRLPPPFFLALPCKGVSAR